MKIITRLLLLALVLKVNGLMAQRHTAKPDTIPNEQLEKFYTYLNNHLEYDKKTREERTFGQVIVAFKIGPNHIPNDIKILKSADTSLSDAVIKLVKSSIPPSLKKAGVTYVLPVFFKLTGGGIEESNNIRPPLNKAELSKFIHSPFYLFDEISIRCYLGYPGQSVIISEDSFASLELKNKSFTKFIHYPAIAREYLISDSVVLWFAVNTDQKVRYAKILSDPKSGISDAIIAALVNTIFPPNIKPDIQYRMNLNFKLATRDTDLRLPPASTSNTMVVYNPKNVEIPTNQSVQMLDEMVLTAFVKKPQN